MVLGLFLMRRLLNLLQLLHRLITRHVRNDDNRWTAAHLLLAQLHLGDGVMRHRVTPDGRLVVLQLKQLAAGSDFLRGMRRHRTHDGVRVR